MNNTSMALALSAFSFLLTLIWGQPLLRVLRMLKIGEHIRVDGPKSHLSKLGTPTMGGVLIMFPLALLTILFNAVKVFGVSIFGNSTLVPLIVFGAFALIGSVDDWFSLREIGDGEGLSALPKLILQLVISIATVLVLRMVLDVPELYLPGIDFEIKLGPQSLYFIYTVLDEKRNQIIGMGTNKFERGRFSSLGPGRYRVVASVENHHLQPGIYTPSVAIRNEETMETYSRLRGGVSFAVSVDPGRLPGGVVRVDEEWSIRPLD